MLQERIEGKWRDHEEQESKEDELLQRVEIAEKIKISPSTAAAATVKTFRSLARTTEPFAVLLLAVLFVAEIATPTGR